jgi:TPR repeat protein
VAALLALSAAVATPAAAGLNEGIVAQQKGEFLTAIKEFMPLAKAGNTVAQVKLAEIYFNGGQGVERNVEQGMEWLRKAVAGGNVDAIFFYAQVLINGSLNQTKNVPEAVRLLELIATKANDQRAMAVLAPIYLQGNGVAKDERRAVALYMKLGELGNGGAWRVLAGLASSGQAGLPQDPATVVGYLAKGVAAGDVLSHLHLGQYYLQGQGVAKDEKEGGRLIQLAAEGGDFSAMMAMANFHISGTGGFSADNEAALKWLSIVLNRSPQGDAYFQASLAAQDLRNRMSNAAIARAQEEAGRWQPKPIRATQAPAKKP